MLSIYAVGMFLVLGVLWTLWLTSFFLIASHPLAKHRGKILALIFFIMAVPFLIGDRNV